MKLQIFYKSYTLLKMHNKESLFTMCLPLCKYCVLQCRFIKRHDEVGRGAFWKRVGTEGEGTQQEKGVQGDCEQNESGTSR